MKKALSIILILCLMFSIMPAASMAAEGDIGEDPTMPALPENIVEQALGSGVIRVDRNTGKLLEVDGVSGVTVIPTSVEGITITSILTGAELNAEGDVIKMRSAFDLSPNLTSVVLPGTITELPSYAFINNEELSELTLSNGFTAIRNFALVNSELRLINIPSTVTLIEPQFSDSEYLDVNIAADNATYVMDNAVLYTADLRTVICAPELTASNTSLTFHTRTRTISASAFEGRKNLLSVTFSDGVRVIEDAAFKNCRELNAVIINNGVTRVGNELFYGCEDLVRVNMPDTITTYGNYMFANCEKLSVLSVPASWKTVPVGMYMNTSVYTIPNLENIEVIENYAFYMNSGIKIVDFVGTPVEVIGEHAFERCTSLTSLTLNNGMEIQESAFASSGITGSLNIPERIHFVGGLQFGDCQYIETVSIGRNITTLGNGMFSNCPMLKAAMIPETTENINNAFGGYADTFTITGYAGSDAHRYAVSNIIPFVSIGEAEIKLTDIEGHWGQADIEQTYYKGLFGGMTPTTFEPETQMTRGMFTTVLQRLAQERTSNGYYFEDVTPGAYYVDSVNWAVESGVAYGTAPNFFSPANNVTRQDLCTMLYRYAQHKNYDIDVYDLMFEDQENGLPVGLDKFLDGNSVSGYAQEAMIWAIYMGIILGNNDMINPWGNAKRAEVAAIINRFSAIYPN